MYKFRFLLRSNGLLCNTRVNLDHLQKTDLIESQSIFYNILILKTMVLYLLSPDGYHDGGIYKELTRETL
jgi:hypothetical protein